ncbi:glucose-6-phosphate isomerase [Tumidithrix elongata RA019]|uniref:Glucose-6-phosphate isomerase n=1 Tax=Tumidithrix elongata BACA0141 TaxID=2716417 RepID=A0AAW9Q330_9CYAN|nr:glucose-6-phosphate isomerase [Tumidithrix elongata RA019]
MDLATELWQRYQDWLYYHAELGLYVDISRMRFTPDFVSAMEPKLKQAFADMKALESGAIANPDEQRMVGHYWLRAPELAPTVDLRQDIVTTVDRIEAFVRDVHTGAVHPPNAAKFTNILSIGIGGSALGPQFVAQCLATAEPPLQISFIDNTDPDGIDLVLAQLGDRLATTLAIVISKSGGTPEAANGAKEVQYAYEQAGLDFSKYAVAVTGKDSSLEKLAKQSGWLDVFPMWDWVGGRTSELSAVGLLPAALQGVDIRAMLQGAKIMDAATRVENLKQNPAALLAIAWYFSGNGKGEKDMVVLPYKDRLLLFSRYLQQLIMESLGKEKDLAGNTVYQGIAVYGNKGSTDQHAYVQQLREGVANFFATFIEVLHDSDKPHPEVEVGITSGDYLSGLLQGTRQALYENGRDSITVTIPTVSALNVGALIALYERTVSFYASFVNVNAYHQPGVEAGKKAAAKVLALQTRLMELLKAEGGKLSLEQIAEKIAATSEIEVLYRIVRHLHANQRLHLEGELSKPASLLVSLN